MNIKIIIFVIIAAIAVFVLISHLMSTKKFKLNYEVMVTLDAEDLAEQGMQEAYKKLTPKLSEYVPSPPPIEEIINSKLPSYKIKVQNETHIIYAPEIKGSDSESWGRATYYFFQIVNSHLKNSPVKFYALNAGNDLGGMFLTEEEFELSKKSLLKKSDWPYIPTLNQPWYGQEH